ncbi:MAG: EAL domain-containing protein, partial [Mariprofundales bacterium]
MKQSQHTQSQPPPEQTTIRALKARIRMLEGATHDPQHQLNIQQGLAQQCQQKQVHKSIMDNSSCGIMVYTPNGIVLEMNTMAKNMLGYHANKVYGENRTAEALLQQSERGMTEQKLTRSDGSSIWVRVNFSHSKIMGKSAHIAIIEDITHRVRSELALQKGYAQIEKRVQERTRKLEIRNKKLSQMIAERQKSETILRDLSYYDTLTKLSNRRHFMDRLTHATKVARRNSERLALFFIDIDYFKDINDTMGHSVGDLVLREVAQRLTSTVRASDSVARLGGDEFAILIEKVRDQSEVTKMAEKVIAAFRAPFKIKKEEFHIHCSLGISLFPDHARKTAKLLKCADIALYKAKEVHNNYQTFNTLKQAHTRHLSQLHRDITGIMKHDQLELRYQPKIDLKSRTITGVEALLRWQHPQKGEISPVDFIPIAEETGMIIEIGKWIINEACQTLNAWEECSHHNLHMAINLSPIQFTDKTLFDSAQQIIKKNHVAPEQIEFEITESLAMKDCQHTLQTIQQFVDMGISIALDDFGTGHSSISRLREMPIHTQKIDRCFNKDMHQSDNGTSFVRMIMNMAKMLNLSVVAEGVENEEQASFLNRLNCETGQGYLFSKPISSDAVLQMLNRGIDAKAACQPHEYHAMVLE